jgi:hypothetical protein
MSDTIPAEVKEIRSDAPAMDAQFKPLERNATQTTCVIPFHAAEGMLSNKPLRRPSRTRPIRDLTNEQLERIAAVNRPPAEWFEADEERPF